MSTAANKDLVRRFEEAVWNERDPSRVDEFFAASHIFRAAESPPLDREGHRQMIAHFLDAFPDGHNTSEELLADGDKVVQRWTFRGTHQGTFQGIPPTGRPVTLTGISIWRVADGKIVESWHELDTLGLLQQLGAIPTPGQSDPSSSPNLSQKRDRDPSASPVENRAVVHRLIDGFWNAGQAEVFDEVFAPDYVDHNPAPGQSPDREGFRQFASALRTALPDMHSTVDDLMAERDQVAWRYSLQATHTGPLLGIPASGKHITMTGISIDRFAGGQIVERWSELDTLGLLSQLGAVSVTGFQFDF